MFQGMGGGGDVLREEGGGGEGSYFQGGGESRPNTGLRCMLGSAHTHTQLIHRHYTLLA